MTSSIFVWYPNTGRWCWWDLGEQFDDPGQVDQVDPHAVVEPTLGLGAAQTLEEMPRIPNCRTIRRLVRP